MESILERIEIELCKKEEEWDAEWEKTVTAELQSVIEWKRKRCAAAEAGNWPGHYKYWLTHRKNDFCKEARDTFRNVLERLERTLTDKRREWKEEQFSQVTHTEWEDECRLWLSIIQTMRSQMNDDEVGEMTLDRLIDGFHKREPLEQQEEEVLISWALEARSMAGLLGKKGAEDGTGRRTI